MPTNNYTTPGTYTWTAPQFTNQVIATVIGGGGAGFKIVMVMMKVVEEEVEHLVGELLLYHKELY